MAYTTINKSGDYFNTKLYSGTGSSQAVTGVGFQPDWVWLKSRSNANDHKIFDVVRGVPKFLSSNLTNAEATTSNFSSIDSDGFTVTSNSTAYNESGQTYASWNWLGANGTSANTDGSISSTVSANTTSGFSIVQYSGNATAGATVGHGLGSVPKMVIVKKTNGAKDWNVYHVGMGATKGMYLNLTNAEQTHGNWNNTTPTNTVFSIGSDDQVNGSGQTYIAYCFAEKTGYSKFSSYTGNGNADGTFVYTGFKPAFVMVKNTQQGGDNWFIWDNKRPGYNQTQKYLSPNSSNAEADSSSYAIDTLSNGFKVRASTGAINNNNETMIYMAFASAPLVGTNNVPANAR